MAGAPELDLGAAEPSDGRLRGEGPEAQARRRASRTTSPSATRTSRASSACSRMPAARWCRSCSRRSTRRITAPTFRSSSRTSTASITGHAGSNGLKFIRQLRRVRHQGQVQILGGFTPVDESLLQQMGEDGARRHHRQLVFGAARQSDQQEFVADDPEGIQGRSRRLCGRDLSLRRGARARRQGDRRQGRGQGRLHEGAARARRCRRSLRGPMSFDEFGNVVGNIYIRKVEKQGRQVRQRGGQDLSERQPVLDLQARTSS